MRSVAGLAGVLAVALGGAGESHAQGWFNEAQMSDINCVFTGILASTDEAARIGELALSARESTYNADVLDEALSPFVAACAREHGWSEAQAQSSRALGAVSAALNSQVSIAIDAGATREEVAQVMPLADNLSDVLRDMLASGSRADDDTRAALAGAIREAGLKPADRAMEELVYVFELAARSREAQLELGGKLFP